MVKQTKRMKKMTVLVPNSNPMPLADAVSILKKFNTTKFDQTVEIAMRLGIDPKQADQIVRGSIVLPHGIGKSLRVAIFAKGAKADEARNAGADFIGEADMAEKMKGGWVDFDVCIATPDMMGIVGPLGKILGPRGLMPSPRAGTVTMDVEKTIKEYKAGKVEFRSDKEGGIVHAVVGKLSFETSKLQENIEVFLQFITNLKPNAVKGQYIKTVALSATMSPSVRVAV